MGCILRQAWAPRACREQLSSCRRAPESGGAEDKNQKTKFPSPIYIRRKKVEKERGSTPSASCSSTCIQALPWMEPAPPNASPRVNLPISTSGKSRGSIPDPTSMKEPPDSNRQGHGRVHQIRCPCNFLASWLGFRAAVEESASLCHGDEMSAGRLPALGIPWLCSGCSLSKRLEAETGLKTTRARSPLRSGVILRGMHGG